MLVDFFAAPPNLTYFEMDSEYERFDTDGSETEEDRHHMYQVYVATLLIQYS